MKNTHSAVRAQARPLAPVSILLVLAVTTHALLVGCGGKSQESSTSTSTTSEAQMAQPAADSGSVGGDEVALGNKVYTDRCALCHGPEGKGDGAAAAGLNPKPRNHTDGTYMNARTDEELLGVIRSGKGAMPAWGNVLSEAEIQAVLKHVRSLAK